jgi:hypothetical protein
VKLPMEAVVNIANDTGDLVRCVDLSFNDIRREPPPLIAVVRHVSGEVAPYEQTDHEMRPPWNQLPSLRV